MPAKTSTPHNGAEEEGLLTSESGSRLMTLQTTEGRLPLAEVLQRNLPAAVTVAIVSISLSIALGIASGAGPQAGLSTAVWGGIAGGLFASSPYNIIGPAGALAPILNSYSVQWGAGILPWISAGSSLLVFATYATGVQKYMLIMPKAVFEGFTVAVAVTIGLSQIPAGFGLVTAKHAHFLANLLESLAHLPEAKAASALVFVPQARPAAPGPGLPWPRAASPRRATTHRARSCRRRWACTRCSGRRRGCRGWRWCRSPRCRSAGSARRQSGGCPRSSRATESSRRSSSARPASR